MVFALVRVAAVWVGLSGGQALVLWLGSLLARVSRAVMMPGVVSVMVARKVACRMGRVPDDLNVERVEQFGLQARRQGGQVGGDFGQQADQVGGGGRGGVGGQVVKLGLDVLAFAVQGGVVGADAAAVGLPGFIGHVEGLVQFAHQVLLPGGQPLEPLGQGSGLPVVLGLPGGGGVRDELGQPLLPPGRQRIRR